MPTAGKHKLYAALWCCLLALLLIDAARLWSLGLPIDGDIFSVLPDRYDDESVNEAIKTYQRALNNKVLFFVGGEDVVLAQKAAAMLVENLKGGEGIEAVSGKVDRSSKADNALFYQHRYHLLSSETRELLEHGNTEALQQRSLHMLYSPISVVDSSLLQSDPQLLFVDYLRDLSGNASTFSIRDQWLTREYQQSTYFFIDVSLGDRPLSMNSQVVLVDSIRRMQGNVEEIYPDVTIVSVGAVYHAAAGISQGKREVSTVGVGSGIGILLLLLFTFRSSVPLLFSGIAIGSGVLAAFLVCAHVFGRVHVMSLVFGASLIGVTIDYAFHYYTEKNMEGKSGGARTALQRVLPGITLGMMTSIIAYAAMGIGPFLLMQQVALFSAVGLLASFISVVTLFPLWNRSSGQVAVLARSFTHWAHHAPEHLTGAHKLALLLLLVFVMLPGVLSLAPSDDIRLLQSPPASLKEEENKFFDILGGRSVLPFFLVSGKDVETVLQREEGLLAELKLLQASGDVGQARGITQFLPSLRSQDQNYALRRSNLEENARQWQQYYQGIGMDGTQQAAFLTQLKSHENNRMTLSDFRETSLFERMESLWVGAVGDRYYSVVTLTDVHDIEILGGLGARLKGVTWVDQVGDFSTMLKEYRESTTLWVLFAYCVIALFLMGRYGWQRGLVYMVPPLVAAWVALGTVGYLGLVINLFTVFALILILGIGIDYVVFFAENTGSAEPTLLSITLSAITTILSFGLLALSQTHAISGFGYTMLAGIGCVYFLSPIYAMKK